MPNTEVGWTPELYIVRALDALARQGQLLDTETFSLLTGTYLPESRLVPGASWYPGFGQALLYGDGPGFRLAGSGVRAAVRVR